MRTTTSTSIIVIGISLAGWGEMGGGEVLGGIIDVRIVGILAIIMMMVLCWGDLAGHSQH